MSIPAVLTAVFIICCLAWGGVFLLQALLWLIGVFAVCAVFLFNLVLASTWALWSIFQPTKAREWLGTRENGQYGR